MSAKPAKETPVIPRPQVPDPFKDRDAPQLDPFVQLKGAGA